MANESVVIVYFLEQLTILFSTLACLMTLCTLTRLRVCDPRVVMRSEVCQGWNYHPDYI